MIITTKAGKKLTICDECGMWDRDAGVHDTRCSVGLTALAEQLTAEVEKNRKTAERVVKSSRRRPSPALSTLSTYTDPFGLIGTRTGRAPVDGPNVEEVER